MTIQEKEDLDKELANPEAAAADQAAKDNEGKEEKSPRERAAESEQNTYDGTFHDPKNSKVRFFSDDSGKSDDGLGGEVGGVNNWMRKKSK